MGIDLTQHSRPVRRRGYILAMAAMVLAPFGAASAKSSQSTLITGAKIVDGTGAHARSGSVRIERRQDRRCR